MTRIQKLQAKLASQKLGGVIISKPQNVRYLSNFVGSNGRLFITPKRATLITDFRYLRSARKQMPNDIEIYDQKEGLKKLVGRVKTIGLEMNHLTHEQFLALKKGLSGVQFKSISEWVETMRMIKDANEIKIIKKAVHIADQAFLELKKHVKAGVSEDDLEWKLLSIARELGADGFSFPPIICFGKNTADVHHIKEPNTLKKGESVLIDMGIEYQGYMTDMTRTFYPWGASKDEQKIYSLVLEANQKAIAAIEVGKTTGEIDLVARAVIEQAGYGDYFGHSTGHGVGLEVHELPHVSTRAKTKIVPGMVFTVEPGIYLNHLGGVRIEDMVYVNSKGQVEVLTTPERAL
ncbi:aminopeptidase P family protein [Candidatus Peregrinibacteria bacterium]|nr:MAG: aminopeptidase P family protein [Candidatus Peregrinibacteria bacterium]